jgi:hypothetical protein
LSSIRVSGVLAGFRRTLGFEPGFGLGFLRRFDRGLGRRLALGAQLLDQLLAIVAAVDRRAIVDVLGFDGRRALGRLGDRGVELALRA